MKCNPIIDFLTQDKLFSTQLSFGVALQKKTSFQCNAVAGAIFTPDTTKDLGRFLQLVAGAGFLYLQDFHVLGKGSNLLFKDGGYRGCLIDLSQLNAIETLEKNATWTLRVQAGVGMGSLLQKLRKQGYTGFEFVFGIPGSIGGGIRMNAGTPDGWFANIVSVVEGFTAAGDFFAKEVTAKDFLYRDFPFGRDKIVTAGICKFSKSTCEAVEGLIKAAKDKRARQPLNYPNFGSVFKNPKPHFAGALVEQVGLKGLQIGQAQISNKHANFMINHGGATFVDVEALISTAQTKVLHEKNIYLETEVHILGSK